MTNTLEKKDLSNRIVYRYTHALKTILQSRIHILMTLDEFQTTHIAEERQHTARTQSVRETRLRNRKNCINEFGNFVAAARGVRCGIAAARPQCLPKHCAALRKHESDSRI